MWVWPNSDLRLLLLRRKRKAEQPLLDAVAVPVRAENAHALKGPEQRLRARRAPQVAVAADAQDRQAAEFLRKTVGIGAVVAEMDHGVRPLPPHGKLHKFLLAMRIRKDQKLHGVTSFAFGAYIIAGHRAGGNHL